MAILTDKELDKLRQDASRVMPAINYNKDEINTAFQAIEDYVVVNRGSLPDTITVSTILAVQRDAMYALIVGPLASGPDWTDAQRAVIANLIGARNEIVTPPVTPKEEADAVQDAITTEMARVLNTALDTADPTLTGEQKRRAVLFWRRNI